MTQHLEFMGSHFSDVASAFAETPTASVCWCQIAVIIMYTSLSWFSDQTKDVTPRVLVLGHPALHKPNFICLYLHFDHCVILAIFWNLWILLYQYGILYLWSPFVCDIKSLDYHLPSLCFIYGALPALRQATYIYIIQTLIPPVR